MSEQLPTAPTAVGYFAELASYGVTEHLGGLKATRRLLRLCRLGRGQRVLEVGCGSGYTSALLSGRLGAWTVSVEPVRPLLEQARSRLGTWAHFAEASALALPFRDASFDAVIAESVLLFTEPSLALREFARVVRPGGMVGNIEGTWRREPPAGALAQAGQAVARLYGVPALPFREAEHRRRFLEAGLELVTVATGRLGGLRALLNGLRTDGRRFLAMISRQVRDPGLKDRHFNPEIKAASRLLRRCGGYGIYVGRKPAG